MMALTNTPRNDFPTLSINDYSLFTDGSHHCGNEKVPTPNNRAIDVHCLAVDDLQVFSATKAEGAKGSELETNPPPWSYNISGDDQSRALALDLAREVREVPVEIDRSQTCSPCPSLVYSDTDDNEESRDGKYKTAGGATSNSPNTTLQSLWFDEPGLHRDETGYPPGENPQDRGNDRSDDRDDSFSEYPQGRAQNKQKRRGNDQVNLACPFRKHNPLYFNIREYHLCSSTAFRDLDSLCQHLTRNHAPRPRHEANTNAGHTTQCLGCGSQGGEVPKDRGHIPRGIMDRIERECASANASWENIYQILFPTAPVVPEPSQYYISTSPIIPGEYSADLPFINRPIYITILAFQDPIELNEVAAEFHESFHHLDKSMSSLKDSCMHEIKEGRTVELVIENAFTGMKEAARFFVTDTLTKSQIDIYLGKQFIANFCGRSWPDLLALPNDTSATSEAWSAFSTPPTTAFTPSNNESTNIKGEDEEGLSNEDPTKSKEMHDDDIVDDLVCKVTDIILDYDHCGGDRDGEFGANVKRVSSLAEEFVNGVLNVLTTSSSMTPYIQHGPGNMPSSDGTFGPTHSFSVQDASGTGQEEWQSDGRRGSRRKRENGSEEGGEPPDSRDGPLDYKSEKTFGSGWSCPFRKRNPSRFNPVDFHSCATQEWKTFNLLKRHIRNQHLRNDHEANLQFRCSRCKNGFPQEELLNLHMMGEFCPIVFAKPQTNLDPEDGITSNMDRLLSARDRDSKINSWHSLWVTIFPGDQPCDIRSSAYEPPDEIEEIRGVFRDSAATRSLESKLLSMLRSTLPPENHGLLATLLEANIKIFQAHIEQQLDSRKSLRKKHAHSAKAQSYRSPGTVRGGVKKRRTDFAGRSGSTGTTYERTAEATMMPPRTLLPAEQQPSTMGYGSPNTDALWGTGTWDLPPLSTTRIAISSLGGQENLEATRNGSTEREIGSLMTNFQTLLHAGSSSNFQSGQTCQGPWPCTTASLLALIKLAGGVAQYIASAAGAPTTRRKLRGEIMACEHVLQDILYESNDFDGGENWRDTVNTLEGSNGPLERLVVALQAVEAKLRPKAGSGRDIRNKLGLSRLTWPFSEKEVQQLLDTIEREKSLLTLALENDCRRLIRAVDETAKDNQQLLVNLISLIQADSEEDKKRTSDLINAMNRVEVSQASLQKNIGRQQNLEEENRNTAHRKAILEWLTPFDYASQQSDYINQREPGTGEWLLASPEYEEWLSGTGKRTLFCPGIPGAGKTILSSVTIDQLNTIFGNNKRVAVAFIYCNFRRQDQQSARDLLSSLLRQVAQRDDSLPAVSEALELLNDRYMQRRTRPSVDVLSKLLHSVVPAYSRVFLIVDALDECPTTGGCRSQFVSELSTLPKAFDTVNLFVTSRWIPDIRDVFLSEETTEVEIRARTEDVRKYTTGRLSHLPGFVARNQALQGEILEAVETAVDGMFLLAQLHLDSLVGKKSPKALRAALARLPSGSQAYEHAYKDAMTRIESQVIDQVELAKGALSWITCAKRPLTTAELQHALAIETGTDKFDLESIPELEDIVSSCAGLVTVDTQSDIVRLVHYTTQEYFERTKDEWFPDMEGELSVACVTYLSYGCFKGLYLKPEKDFNTIIEPYPLFNYACHKWGHHAREANLCDSSPYLDHILRFLDPGSDSCWSSVSTLLAGESDHFCYGPKQNLWSDPMSGLHLAAYFGIPDAVSRLISGPNSLERPDNSHRTPLSWAAEKGHTLIVGMVLQQGSAPDSENLDGKTPLNWAAKRGHEEIVRLLVQKGANPDCACHSQRTPLSRAASRGHLSVVRLLIEEYKVRVDPPDEYGQTPLFRDAGNGHASVVQYLCTKEGANPNWTDIHGTTALMRAAGWADSKECVRALFDAGADASARQHDGLTALSFACQYGNHEVVELLLERGTDPEIEDASSGMSPLCWAARHGHVTVAQLLLNTCDGRISKDHEKRYRSYCLEWAAENGNTEMAEQLLEEGADVNIRDSLQMTPLHLSIRNGHTVISEILLDRGADIEARDDDKSGETPIMWAIERNRPKLVEFFISKGANLRKCDRLGRNPLIRAIHGGREEMIEVILKSDADFQGKDERPDEGDVARDLIPKSPALVDMPDREGETPLYLAASLGAPGMVKLLLNAGASIEPRPNTWSAIYGAARCSDPAVFTLLLDKGADPNRKCKYGWTALAAAASMGATDMVEALLEAGAEINTSDAWGMTPLYRAVEAGHLSAVDALLSSEAACAIKAKGGMGETPLLRAALLGNLAVVGRLCQAPGEWVNSPDPCGQTPLVWAIIKGHTKVAEVLLSEGKADPELADHHGSTPLSIAARLRPSQRSVESVKLLLRTGKVSVTSKDAFGRTPLAWAERSSNRDSEMLLQRYADPKEALKLGSDSDGQIVLDMSLVEMDDDNENWVYCGIHGPAERKSAAR
ncbi:Ankyrin repeat-containing domain protein [Rhypophila decipiens]